MRLTGFHVEGFGLLHDQAVEDIGPGTTVVLGPNEAGKSTLHAFLVRTLFGHPRANDAEGRNRHEPLRGGRHGGAVTCDHEAGHWEVHRYTEGSPRLRVVAPDGSEATGTDAVMPLLGRTVDEARYEQVFAIDLDDLAGIGSLGGGSLDDLLFDAATVGTGRSLRVARDEAVERRDALWTPTSTKRPLSLALTRRAEARSALAAARDAARNNLDTRWRLDEAAARVEQLAAEQQCQTARIALLERVRDAWPSWSRAEQLRAELAELPEAEVEDALLARARNSVADLEAAARRRADLVDELERVDGAIDATDLDPDALTLAEEVEVLGEGLGAHELALEQLAAAESALAAAEHAAERALSDLGDGWDERRVRTTPTDAPTRQRLAGAGDALLDAELRAEAAAEQAADARRTAQRRARAADEAAAELPDAPAEEEVAVTQRAVGVLRVGVPALDRGGARAVPPSPGAAAGRRAAVVGGVLLGIAAVAVAAAVVGVLPPGAPAVVAAGAGAVLAAVGAYLLGGARRTSPPSSGRPPAPAGLAAEVAEAAAQLGLPARPSLRDVEDVAISVEADRRRRRERADAVRHLTGLRTEAEEAGRLAEGRATVAADRGRERDEAVSTWAALCIDVGLDPEESVRVSLTCHERIAVAQRALDDRDAAAADVARIRPRVDQFRAEATATAAKLGHDAEGQVAVRLVPGLRDRVRTAREAQAERDRCAARREELKGQLEQVAADAERARGIRDDTLAAAGVDDVDALEARAQLAARRKAIESDLVAAERNVGHLLGSGPRGEEGRALLCQADPTAWDGQLGAAQEAAATLARERDDALAERTELEAALRRLGGDDAVPRAEQELAAAELEVGELAERWAVADTAARLLEQTVERFEREQQPRVLTRASELLERATGGNWTQVRRLDQQVVVARREGGDPVPAEVLSRGTREQLWLCLRLALAEDLSADRPLPLLVDDLLGTSDPERSLHVARVLADVARRQQVWLFTCHPRTADLVTSTDPTAGVLELRRGGTIAGLRRRDAATNEDDLKLDV